MGLLIGLIIWALFVTAGYVEPGAYPPEPPVRQL